MNFAVYHAEQLRQEVRFTDLIAPMRQAFQDYSGGRAQQVMATLWPAERPADGDVLIKAGSIDGHDVFVVKTAPWFRSNEVAGRPQGGMVTVFDSQTGHPRAVLVDEHYLSDIRTAATGALAADLLATSDATTAGVLGTGTQAYWQILALAHVRPLERVSIWGRNRDRARALAERIAAELPGITAETVALPEQAVRDLDVVITATAATEPLVVASWLRGGQHILAVGADNPAKRELAPEVLARADLLVVDSREAAAENGNTRSALHTGAAGMDELVELGELPEGVRLRSPDDLTIASFVGIGIQDVVAAEVALALLTSSANDGIALPA